MNSKLIFFIALVLNFTVTAAFANNPDKVLGVWVTQDSDSKVEIFKKDNKYYGKIVWLKTPMDNNKPVVDKFNPKEKLKTRPVLGLVVLNDLKYNDNEWEDGKVYDPKTGKTYDCKMWIDEKDNSIIHIKGFIGFSLIGKEVKWKKAII